MKKLKFEIELTISDNITDNVCIQEIARNIGEGLINEVNTRGLIPDYADAFTTSISVKPQFSDEANEISLIDLFKGEFVNDGSEYQICDYVVSSYNNDDGFCVLVIEDYEGVKLEEYSGVGMISEDDDYETRDNFEKTIISLLKGSDLI